MKYSQNSFLCNSHSFGYLNLAPFHCNAQKSTVVFIVHITCFGAYLNSFSNLFSSSLIIS
ncbi:MAG: hypothetical protein Q8M44_03055 [bacterium]|nr:hypothetical protein [bacterium]